MLHELSENPFQGEEDLEGCALLASTVKATPAAGFTFETEGLLASGGTDHSQFMVIKDSHQLSADTATVWAIHLPLPDHDAVVESAMVFARSGHEALLGDSFGGDSYACWCHSVNGVEHDGGAVALHVYFVSPATKAVELGTALAALVGVEGFAVSTGADWAEIIL